MRRASYILMVSAVLLASCGYSSRALLPGHIKKLCIPTFENDTTRYGIEQEVTVAVTEAFENDGRLSVVSESDADAMLRGAIVGYEKGPLTFDRGQSVDEFRVDVVVSIEFEDLKEGRILWKEESFRAWKSYKEGSADGGEEEAVKAAILTLASDILSRSVEGW